MLYQYLNASFQGTIHHNYRQGHGIIVDNNNNFISSDFREDLLDGPTLVCLHRDIIIYGSFKDGKMEGVNIIDSTDYKMIGKYQEGAIIGKGIVINKISKKIYVIDNDKNKKWNSTSLSASKQKEGGWESRLSVLNRYSWTSQNIKFVSEETEIQLQDLQISQFLQIITTSECLSTQSNHQLYFGFVGLPDNLGVTLSTYNTNYQTGLYKQPFVKSNKNRKKNLESSNLIHNIAFFPQLIHVKQNFINVLKFINIFEDRLVHLENSDLIIHEESEKSQNIFSNNLPQQVNILAGSSNHLSETIRKSIAIEKLNQSLEQLLAMQEAMISRKSKQKDRSKDKQKWLLSYEQQEKFCLRTNKIKLKQQMFMYMEQQKSHVIPKSKSKGRSPTKSPKRKMPKSPKKKLTNKKDQKK